jgi:hypothetical protein
MTDDDRALALARQIAQCATCTGRGSYPRRKTWETYEYVLETVTCHWCDGTGANPGTLSAIRAAFDEVRAEERDLVMAGAPDVAPSRAGTPPDEP